MFFKILIIFITLTQSIKTKKNIIVLENSLFVLENVKKSKKLKKLFFLTKLKKTLILLSNLQFLVIFAQYEHTTYDYVLDIFLFCVRDSYVCVREKLYFIKL